MAVIELALKPDRDSSTSHQVYSLGDRTAIPGSTRANRDRALACRRLPGQGVANPATTGPGCWGECPILVAIAQLSILSAAPVTLLCLDCGIREREDRRVLARERVRCNSAVDLFSPYLYLDERSRMPASLAVCMPTMARRCQAARSSTRWSSAITTSRHQRDAVHCARIRERLEVRWSS